MSELDLKAAALRQTSEQSFQQLKIDSATSGAFCGLRLARSCGARRRLYAIATSAAFAASEGRSCDPLPSPGQVEQAPRAEFRLGERFRHVQTTSEAAAGG
uniref:hypothetical protein n=1 Tax=Rosistilla oblonga TaxID=2527990 RepID=UPI003A970AA7